MAYDDLYRSSQEARIASEAVHYSLQKFRSPRTAFVDELDQAGFDTRTKNALLNSGDPFFNDLATVLKARKSELQRVDGLGKKAIEKIDSLAEGTNLRSGRQEPSAFALTIWQNAFSDLTRHMNAAENEGFTRLANELALILGLMERSRP